MWMKRVGALGLMLALLGLWSGCEDTSALDKTQKVVNGAGQDAGSAQTPTPPSTPQPPQGEVVSETIYPDLPMQLLTPPERLVVKRVTEAELCPCPGATVSLHQCLQKTEGRCGLAVQATFDAMRRVKEGQGEKEVLAGLGKFIQDSYKKHEFQLEGVPFKGKEGAPVVIVEFADFECPFCNLAREIVKKTLEERGDKVVFYYMHFPLPSHENSMPASAATVAAQKQGRFWEMYDLVFDNQKILSEPKIKNLALEMGLNMEKFEKDWKDPATQQAVEAQRKQGEGANVDSTPTFFINGRKFLGEKTPEGLLEAVDAALAEVEKKP
jgi:protein-disulfide isomerase